MPPFPALALDGVMAGVAHRTASLTDPGQPLSTSVALPSAGLIASALATLAFGLTLLVLPGVRVAPEIPTALFALALAMLTVTLLVSLRGRPIVPSVDSAVSPEVPGLGPAATSKPAPPPVREAPQGARPSFLGRGATWRVLSSAPEPGDETWLSWLPREIRRLGPDPSSVAPGVIASPGRAGNLVAFPVRDYFGGALPPASRGTLSPLPPRARERGLVGDEHLPALSSPRASPFSDEELDRMFPPEGRRGRVFLESAPARIGGCPPWSSSGAVAPGSLRLPEERSQLSVREAEPEDGEDISLAPHGGNGRNSQNTATVAASRRTPREARPVEKDASSSELSQEAANPVPPHLRASGTLLRLAPSPSAARTGKGSLSRSVCASCSKVVVDLRMSGPCPKCLRPLCHDCLRDALVTVGHGWCSDCARAAVAG